MRSTSTFLYMAIGCFGYPSGSSAVRCRMQGDTVTSAEDRAWGLSSGLKGCDTVEKVAAVARVTHKDVKGVPKLIKEGAVWFEYFL